MAWQVQVLTALENDPGYQVSDPHASLTQVMWEQMVSSCLHEYQLHKWCACIWVGPTFIKTYIFLRFILYLIPHLLSSGSPEGVRFHYRCLCVTMWLLGIELGTSGKAVGAFNHWVISPVPFLDFCLFVWFCFYHCCFVLSCFLLFSFVSEEVSTVLLRLALNSCYQVILCVPPEYLGL